MTLLSLVLFLLGFLLGSLTVLVVMAARRLAELEARTKQAGGPRP